MYNYWIDLSLRGEVTSYLVCWCRGVVEALDKLARERPDLACDRVLDVSRSGALAA